MRRPPVLALLLLLPSACGHWPQPGAGGVAEFARPADTVPARNAGLVTHLDCSLANVAVLTTASRQSARSTGQIASLELIAARVQREVAGKLPQDADRTLMFLDNQVAALAPTLVPGKNDARQCTG